MAKNVNRTARMQWKVDTIKNCIYLQCRNKMFLFLDIEIRSSPSFEIPNPAAFILAVGVV